MSETEEATEEKEIPLDFFRPMVIKNRYDPEIANREIPDLPSFGELLDEAEAELADAKNGSPEDEEAAD